MEPVRDKASGSTDGTAGGLPVLVLIKAPHDGTAALEAASDLVRHTPPPVGASIVLGALRLPLVGLYETNRVMFRFKTSIVQIPLNAT